MAAAQKPRFIGLLRFFGIKLPDPNPELTVEKVREIHAMTHGRRRRAGTGWQSPPVYLQPRCRHKGMMYTVIALYGPAASIPFQRYCTSIEAVSTKEAERLVLEEADAELIVAGVLEGEHDMVDEDPTLNPEDAEVASV